MGLPAIIFNLGQGGLGRPLVGEDFISALHFYTANGNLPSGWTTTKRIKQLFSVSDAIAAGILPAYNKNNIYDDANFADATAAIGTIQVTAVGAAGDVVTVTAKVISISTDPLNPGIAINTVVLCTYKLTSADHADGTFATLAASLDAAINANQFNTGFTSTVATDTISVNFPKSQGTYPNSGTPLAVTHTGSTFAATVVQPTGVTPGTQSLQAIWYYHISEFFRAQPQGQLFVAFNPIPTSYDFSDITTAQLFAKGKIRQSGIYLDGNAHVFTTGDLTAIHDEIVANDDANYQWLSALYCANLHGTSDLSTLADLNALSASKVSAVISQDGAAMGNFLFITAGFTIGNIGACLGSVAFAAVSDDIGWIGKFNMSNGRECDTPAFANGTLVSAISQNLLTALNNMRYIFLLKYVGNAGTYWVDSNTAIQVNSDYAYIESNRTINKAQRGVYAGLLDDLKGPLTLNADGTLTNETIAHLTSRANVNLDQMVRDNELSAYKVTIDPKQNVLSSSKLIIAIQLLPVGVARMIIVNIGFTTSIKS